MRRRVVIVSLSVVAVSLAVVGVAWWQAQPPMIPPEYGGARPEPAADGYESVTRSVVIAAPPEAVHAWTNDPDLALEDVVRFDDDFPAVVGTEPIVGDWTVGEREGDRRRVRFADGHYLAEEVLIDRPGRFRYIIWGFTSLQRFVVRHGVAEFVYELDGGGTRLTWTYRLLPTLDVLRPFVRAFLDDTMASMMTATLDGYRRGIEASVREVS